MKIVIDTNIYLSGLIFPESFPGKVLMLARRGKIQVYCSKFILDEIERNLMVKFGYSDAETQKFIDEILKFVQVIQPQIKLDIVKEKKEDNNILECAIVSKATYLITGDKKHILPLKKIEKTRIVSAREFVTEDSK